MSREYFERLNMTWIRVVTLSLVCRARVKPVELAGIRATEVNNDCTVSLAVVPHLPRPPRCMILRFVACFDVE